MSAYLWLAGYAVLGIFFGVPWIYWSLEAWRRIFARKG